MWHCRSCWKHLWRTTASSPSPCTVAALWALSSVSSRNTTWNSSHWSVLHLRSELSFDNAMGTDLVIILVVHYNQEYFHAFLWTAALKLNSVHASTTSYLVEYFYFKRYPLCAGCLFQFGWTHVTLLIIVTQSHLIIQNIFDGIVWLVSSFNIF